MVIFNDKVYVLIESKLLSFDQNIIKKIFLNGICSNRGKTSFFCIGYYNKYYNYHHWKSSMEIIYGNHLWKSSMGIFNRNNK